MDDDLRELLAPKGPRVLTIDLERLPGREPERDIWNPRDVKYRTYSHPDSWIEYPRILCLAARWYGERKYLFSASWHNPDDRWHVAREAKALLDEADCVVTYNGDRADLPWIRSELGEAGLSKPSPFRSIDLFKVAKREFDFESKSLHHLCKRLGVTDKAGKYDATEARAAAAGDPNAQRRITAYNKGDIRATEAVLTRLLEGGWVREMPHIGLWTGVERSCYACGGERLVRDGRSYTAVTAYQRYRCEDCGAYSRNGNRVGNVTMRVAR